jgi:hypothetical protein
MQEGSTNEKALEGMLIIYDTLPRTNKQTNNGIRFH